MLVFFLLSRADPWSNMIYGIDIIYRMVILSGKILLEIKTQAINKIKYERNHSGRRCRFKLFLNVRRLICKHYIHIKPNDDSKVLVEGDTPCQ